MSKIPDVRIEELPDFAAWIPRGQVEIAAKKLAIRLAMESITELIDALKAVKIEGDEEFAKGAAKGIRTAVKLAEGYSRTLRQMP